MLRRRAQQLACKLVPHPRPRHAAPMEPRTHKCTVAIVDDDPLVCRAIGHLAWARGYDAITFTSGRDFIAALQSAPALDVDCVVLDMHMPELDGLEVQRRLAALRPGVPVVFLSGRADAPARAAAMGAGAVAYFLKPLHEDMSEFIRTIEAVLRGEAPDGDA